jgi:WNK lysine deficient protein kinase
MRETSDDHRYIRYKTLIGSGSFKNVYRGFDRHKGRDVAWCKISFDVRDLDRKQMEVEMKLLSRLDHPHILELYRWWKVEEREEINLITELFYAGSLRDFVRNRGAPCMIMIKDWGRQILCGLHYLHHEADDKPILHRDLKLSNILVHGHTGQLKIGDFGLATVKASGRRVVGTMNHMSPEMLDGNYDEKVDIYAFGMCLYELATGQEPYSECKNMGQVVRKITLGVKPSGLQSIEDESLHGIILACISPVHSRPSADELLQTGFFSGVHESWEDVH